MPNSEQGYARKVPKNRNPNAMPTDFAPDFDRARYVRFAIACNHDPDDVLPDSIPEKPIRLPVRLDGVVP